MFWQQYISICAIAILVGFVTARSHPARAIPTGTARWHRHLHRIDTSSTMTSVAAFLSDHDKRNASLSLPSPKTSSSWHEPNRNFPPGHQLLSIIGLLEIWKSIEASMYAGSWKPSGLTPVQSNVSNIYDSHQTDGSQAANYTLTPAADLTTDGATNITATTGGSSNMTAITDDANNATIGTTSAAATTTSTASTATTATTSSVPTPIGTQCPSGSSYQVWEDDFQVFDENKWELASGGHESVSYGKDGLTMTLSENDNDVTFATYKSWTTPVIMSITEQSDYAPGMVSSFCFKQPNASDEIDLELVMKTWQIPLWHNGVRASEKTDGTIWTASGVQSDEVWKYSGPNGFVPYDKQHTYSLEWTTSAITWTIDNNKVFSFTKSSGATGYPAGPLPIRIGGWAAASGWAGELNWNTTPHPKQIVSKVVVEGCLMNA